MEEHMFFSKIQQGDTASFEWLYKRYHPRMYMFCKGILHDEDKAKEILLEDAIHIEIAMKQGDASATAWGCDLTYDYVKINGDYRT